MSALVSFASLFLGSLGTTRHSYKCVFNNRCTHHNRYRLHVHMVIHVYIHLHSFVCSFGYLTLVCKEHVFWYNMAHQSQHDNILNPSLVKSITPSLHHGGGNAGVHPL